MGVLVGGEAMASNSRLAVMGSGDGNVALGAGDMTGSLFYNDAYNMFYNPAYVNDFGHWATIEKGLIGGASGGFVTGLGSMNLGLYFNRASATGHGMFPAGTGRPLDLILGGDTGIKWGVGLTWASQKASSTVNNNDLMLHAGVVVSDFEPFGEIRLLNSAGTPSVNFNTMGLGLKYHMNDWTPYALWTNSKTGSVTTTNHLALGVGHNHKVAEGVMMVCSAGIVKTMTGATTALGSADPTNRFLVPVSVAVEGAATSWLKLRGGFYYNLIDTVGDVSNTNLAQARVGGSLTFTNVDVDFAFGTGADTTGTGLPTAIDGPNVGFDSSTLAMLGVTYKY